MTLGTNKSTTLKEFCVAMLYLEYNNKSRCESSMKFEAITSSAWSLFGILVVCNDGHSRKKLNWKIKNAEHPSRCD